VRHFGFASVETIGRPTAEISLATGSGNQNLAVERQCAYECAHPGPGTIHVATNANHAICVPRVGMQRVPFGAFFYTNVEYSWNVIERQKHGT
jgi:hypothetical protein